jgi:hypothetical protein
MSGKGKRAVAFKDITGTFLDGVAGDIPAHNWGRSQWARQFDVMKEMGMDTVIIIRVGWCDMAMYRSNVMKTTLCDSDDLVALFLAEAERTGLRLYMGLYDSNRTVYGNWGAESALNLELIDELMERYGRHPAFFGWYLSHEPNLDTGPWRIWNPLTRKMRQLTPDKPVILSPRFEGRKYEPKHAKQPGQYAEFFDLTLSQMTEKIDAAAFMDGHVDFRDLPEYASAMKSVLDKHGIEFWSNLETFDRDMPIRFPPIDWTKMRFKLEAVQPYVQKIITFEAPHFLSPYSPWESGRMLFDRYMEYRKTL